MKKMFPRVSILVLNYNGKEVLEKCLRTLLKTNYPNFDITLIDNASTDGSVEIAKKKFKKVKIIQNNENVGFVKGNNIGMEYAMKTLKPDYVVLLNNDTEIVERDWLAKLVKCSESDKKIGIIGCRLVFPGGKTQWAAAEKTKNTISLVLQTLTVGFNPGVGNREIDFMGEVNSVSGACMMIKSGVLKKFGYLDDDLAPYFGEDVELCYRTWKNGYKVFFMGNVKVVHKQSYTFNKYKDELQRKKFFWSLRNSMRISKKYFGFSRTLLYGLPIFTFVIFFERKNKTEMANIFNLKLRDNGVYSIYVWLKSVKELVVG